MSLTHEDLNQPLDNVTAPLKTSIAFDGDARKEGDVHNVTLQVDFTGVTLKDVIEKALANKAVDFQRPRRSKDSNGVFESRESFEEYCEEIGQELQVHWSEIGKAPTAPMTDEEAEAEGMQAFAQMSEEAQQRYLQRLQERTGQ